VEKRANVHEYFSSVLRLAPARGSTLISSDSNARNTLFSAYILESSYNS